MLKSPTYFILGYAVFLFLLYRFVTDQELPLYRIIIRVALSSFCLFLATKAVALVSKPRKRNVS